MRNRELGWAEQGNRGGWAAAGGVPRAEASVSDEGWVWSIAMTERYPSSSDN